MASLGCLAVGVLLAELSTTQALLGFVSAPLATQAAIFGYSLLYLLAADLQLFACSRHTSRG